jgi:hypothetical protein
VASQTRTVPSLGSRHDALPVVAEGDSCHVALVAGHLAFEFAGSRAPLAEFVIAAGTGDDMSSVRAQRDAKAPQHAGASS